jgi:hypothetical protein
MDVFPLSVSISSLQPSYRSQWQRVENDKLQVNSCHDFNSFKKKKKKTMPLILHDYILTPAWLYQIAAMVWLTISMLSLT